LFEKANVAMNRIRTFLLREEIDETQISHEKESTFTAENIDEKVGEQMESISVKLSQVDFGWTDHQEFLHDLNMSIRQGELIAGM
jgi:ABC-type multidrug transport system fused ATPase/permease subunit